MSTVQEIFSGVGLNDILDILLVAVLLYFVFVALQRTRTAFLIVGFVVVAVLYVLALALGLRLTTFVFQVVFAVILLGLIVIFHAEIRVSAERLFSLELGRLRRPQGRKRVVPETVQVIVSTLNDLAKARIGALVVLRGKDDPAHFVHGGYELNGQISEALLKSIFDPHSIGHDGAVIVNRDRITRFGCHLPLSSDTRKLKNRGTRHAAALGMSTRTDALCLVVSEERGVVSIARDGELREIGEAADLTRAVAKFHEEMSPQRPIPFWRDIGTRHLRLKLAALGAAALLWFLVVHESSVEYHSYVVPVEHAGLREGLAVSSIQPAAVKVIVAGPRRAFYFMNEKRFRLVANVLDRGQGEHLIELAATDVTLPEGLTFVNLVPRPVRVTIDKVEPPA